MTDKVSGLDAFFSPSGVAVIGASRDETKLGFGVMRNLAQCGYPGPIYPINPKAPDILGLRCYPSILDVPDPVELAVVIVPVAATTKVIEDCGRRGLKAAIVISGGFREVGDAGARTEREVAAAARRYGMRLMGPNCIGVIDTVTPLDTSFVAMPLPGSIGFFSQSGAICGALVNWTRGRRIGFSRFVSLGNQADVSETDVLEFLGDDPHTTVLASYLEGVSDGRRFLAAARRVSLRKPVVVLKAGGTGDGSRAARSHTGALAGSQQAYGAAFAQSGVLQATTTEDMLDWAHALASQPLPEGDGVAVLTNAGGPGVVAVDALDRAGLHLATLQPETLASLRRRFPPEATLHNPVDLLAAADAQGYADALSLLLRDPGVAGVVLIQVPHVLVRSQEVLAAVGEVAASYRKPVLVSLFGDFGGAPELEVLSRHHLPHFPSPERAGQALGATRRYRRWQEAAATQGRAHAAEIRADRAAAAAILRNARQEGRTALDDAESRRLISAYGISTPRTELARTAEEAAMAAERIGYPVVLKIASPDILHKSDAGGVAVGLADAVAVREAFSGMLARVTKRRPEARIAGVQVQEMAAGAREVIVGVSRDPQFGPVIMFGLGGVYVEALEDVSFRVAPISEADALEMVRETKAHRVLDGLRGEAPSDVAAIVSCLLRVSAMAMDWPEISELDVNPLLVRQAGKGALAVDARVLLDRQDGDLAAA